MFGHFTTSCMKGLKNSIINIWQVPKRTSKISLLYKICWQKFRKNVYIEWSVFASLTQRWSQDPCKYQFPADLVTFTDKILSGKLRFLCSVYIMERRNRKTLHWSLFLRASQITRVITVNSSDLHSLLTDFWQWS